MSANKFDQVLKEVGEFGIYQKRLLILVVITGVCVSLQNQSPVFTMKIPRHRCKILGLDNDTYEVQSPQHASLINRTIPLDDLGAYSKCTMFDASEDYDTDIENRTKVMCKEWVFDKSVFSSTYVTELNLVCGRNHYRSHSTMLIFAGKFFGAFCNSAGGDHFGRRRVYVVMMLAMAATGVGLVFVSSLPFLMVLRFLAGATTTGSYLPSYIIAVELVGPSYRRVISVVTKISGISTALLAGLLAFLLRDWRYFQISLAVPCVAAIVGYFFLPESPRWLASKGRIQEVQSVIDNVARVNGTGEAPKLHDGTSEIKGSKWTSTAAASSPHQIFRYPRLIVRYSLLCLCWIMMVMCVYGLNLNVTNMSGNIFLNYSLMNSVEIVSLLFFALLIERVGRRIFCLVASALAGIACLSTILPTMLGGSSWILRGLSFVGRMCVGSALSTLYLMSPELYPTVLRSFGIGSCSMMSRLGGLASPYIADLNTFVVADWAPALPQMVFGAAGLICAGMTFFLPETRGRNLPETIQDADLFGRYQIDNIQPTIETVKKPLTAENDESCFSEQSNGKQH